MTTKREALERALGEGKVLILLDPRVPGVDVPPSALAPGKPWSVGLHLSWGFRKPMELDDFGVTAELSFSQQPHTCRIPWAAIWLVCPSDGGPEDAFVDMDTVPREAAPPPRVDVPAETAPELEPAADLPANVVPFRRPGTR